MASVSGNSYISTRIDLHGTPACPWYSYCRQLLAAQAEIEKSPFWFKAAPEGSGLSDSEDEDIPPATSTGKNDLSKSAGANAPSISSSRPRFTAGGSHMEAAKNNPGPSVSLQQIKTEPEEMDQNEPDSNEAPYISSEIALGTTTIPRPNPCARSLVLVDFGTSEFVEVNPDEEKQERELLAEYMRKIKDESEKPQKLPTMPEYWKLELKKQQEKERLQLQKTMTLQEIKDENTDVEDETETNHDRNLLIHMNSLSVANKKNNWYGNHTKLTCKECHRSFESKASLKQHKKTHKSGSYDNTDQVKQFHCDLCKETFRGQSSFARHMKIHDKCVSCHALLELSADGQTSKILMCSNCLDNFDQQETNNPPVLALPAPPLRTGNSFNEFEEDSKSTDEVESVCEPDDESDEDYTGSTSCRRRSSSRLAKGKPKKSRLGNGRSRNTCKVCGKSFVYPARYEAHKLKHDNSTPKLEVNRNQTGPRVHVCKEKGCTLTFSTRSAARAHLTAAHLQNSKFSCGKCHEKFRMQHHLDHHMTKHETKRDFACGVCGRKFKSQSSLRSHERRSPQCSNSVEVMVNKDNIGSELLKVTNEDGSVENIRYASSANSLLSEVPGAPDDSGLDSPSFAAAFSNLSNTLDDY